MKSSVALKEDSELTAEAAAVIEEIKSTLGIERVPDFFRVLAYDPQQMQLVWHRIKTLMDPAAPDHKFKHFVALAVCAAVGSSYFCAYHAGALRKEGASDKEIAEILSVADLWTGLSAFSHGLGLEFPG